MIGNLTKDNITEQSYNCIDCLATSRNLEELLKEDGNKGSFKFDQAIIGPALTMQLRGTRIDQGKVKILDEETCDEAAKLQKEFEQIAGKWKWGKSLKPSPIQLAKLLYGDLKVRVRTSKIGSPTCNKEAIASVLDDPKTEEGAFRIAKITQELTNLEEDRKVLRKPAGQDGRMRTSFRVAATSSGRFAAKKSHFDEGSNLQALSRRLHKLFVPDDGWVMVNIDQKQAESKAVAYLSGCKKYKEFHQSGNTHVSVGKLLFPDLNYNEEQSKDIKIPWNPTLTYYDLFKRCQHAANYFQSAFGLSRQIHIPVSEARKIQEIYFSQFPEIRNWQNEIIQELKIYHHLTTPLGRTRLFLGRTWDDSQVKEAISYIPQSLVSQLNKIMLWRVWNYFDPNRAQMLLENHDSLLFQVREGDSETIEEILKLSEIEVLVRGDIMKVAMDSKWGYSWGDEDMHKWKGKF